MKKLDQHHGILYWPLRPSAESSFVGSSDEWAGSIWASGMLVLPLVSLISANTRPTAVAKFCSEPMPPMCINMILGESQTVVVKSGHFQAIVEGRAHDGAYLILK